MHRAMRKQHMPLQRSATEEALAQVSDDLKYANLEAFYVAIGEGHVSPGSVLARLARVAAPAVEEGLEEVPVARPAQVERESSEAVVVEGGTDVWVRLARCCTPVPGDKIMGFITRGTGVSVHRVDCPNAHALSMQSERLVTVSWKSGKPTAFVVAVQVEALDRQRLLGDVATVLSDHQVNILSASTVVGKDRISMLRFTFELGDIGHLASVLQAVKRIDNVYDAYRIVPG